MTERLLGEDARALEARIATIYSRLPGTAAISIFNAVLIILVVRYQQDNPVAVIWLALVVLLSAVRLGAWWSHRRDADRAGHARRWQMLSVIGAFGAGMLWGLGPIVASNVDPLTQWLWAFAIGGMCAGAASFHSAHLPTALAFVVPACLPLSAILLMEGSFAGIVAGTLTLAFIGMTSFTAMLFSREFGKMLALRAALERRAIELHDANRRLSREIDDHRETSEALLQSRKMEALGSLTGGFAHDFNNLLTVIIGNLDLIGRETISRRVRTLVEAATAAAGSGADLTSRLLAFARQQTLAPRLVDVNALVTDFEPVLRHAVNGAISIEFASLTKQAVAPVDPVHLQAALLNLVVNARDAMPEGGRIRILVSKQLLAAEDLVDTDAMPGAYVGLAVSDDGEGIGPEIVKRVFEPFFTTKANSGGTGLGLSQVFGFTRQSGGFVRLESEPGVGTIVTLFLPASDETPPPPERDSGRPAECRADSLSVLLVDDNPGVIAVLAAGLAGRGWTVTTAADAPSALALIEAGPTLDIVVSDIDMPGSFDGLGLAGRIRERWPDLPVLLISGAPIAPDRLGPDIAFLAKPFRNRTLVERIEGLVSVGA